MTKIISLQAIAAALLACGLSTAPAQAGPNRTWVSGHGTDSGGCALVAPCRTFAFAITQTAVGGEIDVLDPAGYGTVTITKAISIVNDGVGTAGIHAGSGNGVTINAGASDSVHLRGLTIEGAGANSVGIQFNTGGNLAIENCVVRNFSSAGISIFPSTSSSFSVSNTIASNNGGGGIGVGAPPGSAVVKGVITNVITNNNFVGITVQAGGHAAVAADVTVRNVVASNNGTVGLFVGANAVLRVAHSVVTGNGTGVFASPGPLFSYGDNDIDGNTNNNTAALTPLAMH